MCISCAIPLEFRTMLNLLISLVTTALYVREIPLNLLNAVTFLPFHIQSTVLAGPRFLMTTVSPISRSLMRTVLRTQCFVKLYHTGRVLSLVSYLSITLAKTGWGCCTEPRSGVSHRQDEVQEIRSSDKNQQGGLYLGCCMKCSKIIKGTAMTHGFGAVT